MKVLVVDDDPDWLQLMKEILENEEYTVATAPNGLAAFEQLPQSEPCVVITDLQMPVLDGQQLLSKVRACDDKLPVIVITADREHVAPGLPGAFRVLGKTAALEGVLSAVAEATAAYRGAVRVARRRSSGVGPWRRLRGAASSLRSRLSSMSPRRLALLSLGVVSAVVLLTQVTTRLARVV